MDSMTAYVKEKIRLITREFYIHLSAAEKAHMYNLPNEIAVDNYVRQIFEQKL